MPFPVDESGSASEESSISRSDNISEHDSVATTTKATAAPNNVGGTHTQEEQTSEAIETGGTSQHRPPTLQHHDGGKTPNHPHSETGESPSAPGPAVPTMTKVVFNYVEKIKNCRTVEYVFRIIIICKIYITAFLWSGQTCIWSKS